MPGADGRRSPIWPIRLRVTHQGQASGPLFAGLTIRPPWLPAVLPQRAVEDPESAPRAIFDRLAAAYGPQGWWPARDPFEMMVGALLTQRTTWRSAERAIASLRRADALAPHALARVPLTELEARVRPAGTFRVKAVRLQALARWYLEAGGSDALAKRSTTTLRVELLGLTGIGPETADDILVYAFSRPVFVVDAYARRILSRYGWARGDEPYRRLSTAVADALGPESATLGEFHALLVEHGKRHCRSTPRCTGCPLAARCRTGMRLAASDCGTRFER